MQSNRPPYSRRVRRHHRPDRSSLADKPKWSIRNGVIRAIEYAGSALVVSLVVASFSASGVSNMASAYGMLTGAWLVGSLLCVLQRWKCRRLVSILIRICGPIGLGLLSALLGTYQNEQRYELTHLVAGSVPSPQTACKVPDGSKAIFLGTDVAFFNQYPHVVLAMQISRTSPVVPLLVIDEHADTIGIKALKIFDENGDIMTDFDDDAFWINSELRSKKASSHELIVFDRHDNVAADVNYLNRSAIRISGTFSFGGSKNQPVSEDSSQSVIMDECIGNSNVDILFFGSGQRKL